MNKYFWVRLRESPDEWSVVHFWEDGDMFSFMGSEYIGYLDKDVLEMGPVLKPPEKWGGTPK